MTGKQIHHGATTDAMTEAVIETIRQLQVALGNARLYDSEHPESVRPLRDFVTRVNDLVGQLGPLNVVSSFEGLRWRGVPVTHEGDEHRGLGQHLHREGIASLTFLMGVDLPEAARLMQALRVNFTLPEFEEETLESMLWQAELEHVQFQAVKALMEAEAISGRGGAESLDQVEHQIRQFLEVDIHDRARQDFSALARQEEERAVGEDQVRRAIEEHDLALEVRSELDALDDDRFWSEYLEHSEEEDSAILAKIRRQVGEESDADMLVRMLMFTLRAALAQRPECPPEVAMGFADGIMERIYAEGDPTGVTRVLAEGRRLFGQLNQGDVQAREFLQRFYISALPPLRVAGLLVGLDFADKEQRDAARMLVANMPDDGLLALLQWSSSEDFERLRPFYVALARGAGKRILRLIPDFDSARVELLIPLIRTLRVVGSSRFKQLRSQLVRHRSLAVREAAMTWLLEEEGLDDDDLPLVLNALMGRLTSMRRIALDILKAKRPEAARARITRELEPDRFEQLSPEQRRVLCVALAYVAGDRAMPTLQRILMTRLPFLVLDGDPIFETLEAAARGIAAINSPTAWEYLEQEASGWPSARKQVCQRVLREERGSS